jgi:hypothetical protein
VHICDTTLMANNNVSEFDYLVVVRRTWNDVGRTAKIPLLKIQNLHWDRWSGGIRSYAPRSFIHGYVLCDEILGNIAHTGVHGKCPHLIKICITKTDNEPQVFQEVKRRAR